MPRALLRVLVLLVTCFPAIVPAFAAAPELTAKLDDLYRRRDDPAALKELGQQLDEAMKTGSKDYDIVCRAARYKGWTAEGSRDPNEKKKLAHEGWQLGEWAVHLKPDGVEGQFLTAFTIGV